MTNITIPNNVTSIGELAFYECISLTDITIPNSVTSIGRDCFKNTAWYNNKEDGLVYINNILYEYKGNMPKNTSITIKEGTNCINSQAFADCSGLTNITIPNSVTSIGDYAFVRCSSLTNITIPNSVTSIGNGAFCDCSGLTGSLTIPNSVTSIGEYAFDDCRGLTNITIPNSVTSIGGWVFNYCSSLTNIDFKGTKNEWNNIRKDSYWKRSSSIKTITCTDGVITI